MRWHKRPDRLHAKAAPPPKDEEEYMERVLQRVRFRFDRPSIRRELLAHLEDKALWLRQQGCGPEEASHRALQEMGDPEETGRALNKTHNPVLGWIWLVTGALARVAAGLSVLLALYLAVDYLLPNSIPAEIDRDEIKEVVEVEANTRIGHMVFRIQRVLRMKDGEVVLLYESWTTSPWDSQWTRQLSRFEDEAGNIYPAVEGTIRSGPVKERACCSIYGVPEGTETLWAPVGDLETAGWVEVPLQDGTDGRDSE